MGSLAVSRVEAPDPAPTIVDEVVSIARKELAPLAAAIDATMSGIGVGVSTASTRDTANEPKAAEPMTRPPDPRLPMCR